MQTKSRDLVKSKQETRHTLYTLIDKSDKIRLNIINLFNNEDNTLNNIAFKLDLP